MDRLQVANGAPRDCRAIQPHCGRPSEVAERGGATQRVVLDKKDIDYLRLADASGVFGDRIEHRLHVTWRIRYHAQDLTDCSLLLQRLGEIVGALLNVLEQSNVLDGNHRLVGESGHQIDLLLAEWVHLVAGERKDADRRPVTQERHAEDGSEPKCPLIASRTVFGIGQHVGDMNDLALQRDAPNRATAARSLRVVERVLPGLARKSVGRAQPIQIPVALKDDALIGRANPGGRTRSAYRAPFADRKSSG